MKVIYWVCSARIVQSFQRKEILTVFLLFSLLKAMVIGQNGPPLTVMTFNVRYDNPSDGVHSWKNRLTSITDLIQQSGADIIGFQEVLYSQLLDLTDAFPDYLHVGVGRKDGDTQGEYCVIMYRKNRFRCVESGTFWLSPYPDSIGSVGWDASMERICTWGIFRDLQIQEDVAVFNTHLDHVGENARNKSADLILHHLEKLSSEIPVILMGDFNADQETLTYKKLAHHNLLVDSRTICGQIKGPDWTYHGFGQVAENVRTSIDFVFVRNGFFEVTYHEHIFHKMGRTYYSDHNPVLVKLQRRDR